MFLHRGKPEYLIGRVYLHKQSWVSSKHDLEQWRQFILSSVGKKYWLKHIRYFCEYTWQHGSFGNVARQRKQSPFWRILVCKNKDYDLMAAIFARETKNCCHIGLFNAMNVTLWPPCRFSYSPCSHIGLTNKELCKIQNQSMVLVKQNKTKQKGK